MFGAGDLIGAEPCFIDDQGRPYGNAMVELTSMADFMRFVTASELLPSSSDSASVRTSSRRADCGQLC